MPWVISPPSNAGPAGQDAAISRSRWPTTTSVLVPTSTSITGRSASAMPIASRQATVSAPTWLPMMGRPTTRARGFRCRPSCRAGACSVVVARRPARKSASTLERYGRWPSPCTSSPNRMSRMVGLPATTICVTEVRRKPQERATVRISVLMALTMACCSSSVKLPAA